MRAGSFALLGLLAPLSGCDRPSETPKDEPFPPAVSTPRYEKAFYQVQEVGRSSPDLPFSNIIALDVDSKGDIYVGDWNTPEVTVISRSGSLVRTIGRKGEGPGEFQNVKSLHVLAGDSLLVFDGSIHRVTVFAPHGERAVHIATLGSQLAIFPASVAPVWNSPLIIADYKPAYTPDDSKSREKHRNEVLWMLDRSGRPVQDSILTFPASEALVYRSFGRLSVRQHPFGRSGIWKLSTRNRLYYSWTGSPTVEVRSLEGQVVRRITARYDPLPLRRSQIDSVGDGLHRRFRKPLEKTAPKTWPAVIDFVVDDREQVWIGLTALPGQFAEWAVFRETGEYVGSVRLPSNVTLKAVRKGMAYGVATDSLDVPMIVVYDLDQRLQGQLS
jgi:hypothetical protein